MVELDAAHHKRNAGRFNCHIANRSQHASLKSQELHARSAGHQRRPLSSPERSTSGSTASCREALLHVMKNKAICNAYQKLACTSRSPSRSSGWILLSTAESVALALRLSASTSLHPERKGQRTGVQRWNFGVKLSERCLHGVTGQSDHLQSVWRQQERVLCTGGLGLVASTLSRVARTGLQGQGEFGVQLLSRFFMHHPLQSHTMVGRSASG